ncbi:MAG: ABC transporter ATP-binding protein [Porticoccaceae bacterium]|nr:ABC transporter ATP-binding protein [Porticoccaceae bacterium]
MIELRKIAKRYMMGEGGFYALDGIDLDIRLNDYLAIVGSSGSGKSTLMNLLGCLDYPTSGQYTLKNTNVATLDENRLAEIRNREIGFIFQNFNLLPRATALQNVMQPLVYQGLAKSQRKEMAEEALQMVGLTDRMHHVPNQLSGGQRQRVAIARALVTKPSILLADEPTGNLDSATTIEIMALFDRLHEEGQTLIIVTHEKEIADRCHRVITLKDGHLISDKNNPISIVKQKTDEVSHV